MHPTYEQHPLGRLLPPMGVSEQIAQMAGVSKGTAKDYHLVQVHGSSQLKEAVDQGEVAISDAAQVARQQLPQQQTEALERVRTGAASTLRQAVAQSRPASANRDPLGLPIPDELLAVFGALPDSKRPRPASPGWNSGSRRYDRARPAGG